jgi:hypothetical protein
MQNINLSELSVRQLLTLHASVPSELRRRGITRTSNVVSCISERIVAAGLDLDLATPSERDIDAVDRRTGDTYQVKARMLAGAGTAPSFRQLGDCNLPIRWDYLAGVLFAPDFSVYRAALLSRVAFERLSRKRSEQTQTLYLTDAVLADSNVHDITAELRAVEL